jgi:hypothetical protein
MSFFLFPFCRRTYLDKAITDATRIQLPGEICTFAHCSLTLISIGGFDQSYASYAQNETR